VHDNYVAVAIKYDVKESSQQQERTGNDSSNDGTVSVFGNIPFFPQGMFYWFQYFSPRQQL